MRCIPLLVTVAFFMSGCGYYFTNVKVENHSDSSMDRVEFISQDGRYAMGTLRPGMVHRFYGRLRSEGAFAVEFDWRGKRRRVGGCYYTMVGETGRFVIENAGAKVACPAHGTLDRRDIRDI